MWPSCPNDAARIRLRPAAARAADASASAFAREPFLVVGGGEGRDGCRDLGQRHERVVEEHRPDARLGRVRTGGGNDLARVRLDDGGPRRGVLVRIPAGRVERLAIGQEGRHRAHHLGWLVEAAQELVDIDPAGGLERLPAAIDQDQPGAAVADRGRGPRSDDRAEPMTGEDDAVGRAGEQARAFRDREHVIGERGWVVALGRGVGQAVPAQVHRDDVTNRPDPACDRIPRPRRIRQPVDQQDPGRAGGRDASPVEEMDPVARLDDDHEAVRLGSVIRRGHGLHRP